MKKHFHILAVAAVLAILSQACSNDSTPSEGATLATEEAVGKTSSTTPGLTDPLAAPAANAAPTAEPPQNAAGVWHYTCPKGCAGGAGAATPCAKCGTTLTHNQTYHGAAQQPAGAAPASNPGATAATAPKKDEPPQNAKGVWHYTCPKGCEGGSGAATPCAKCATVMTHNTAYHQ
ncbi:MAG TPA: hypothetical protein DCF33_06305 [Saprospirales bacterium]|nr:hypothetical protein [Saprospirales bacterium]